MTDERPQPMVVLMGLPRSGTTWLGKIFDSHPDTFYSHEPDSARPFTDVPLLVPTAELDLYRASLERHVQRMSGLRTIRVVGKLPLFAKSYTGILPPRARGQGLVLLKVASRLFRNVTVPSAICGIPQSAPYWAWKSIESCGRLGALARAFPQSRFVFIIRHPCGVAASVFRGEADTKFSAGPSNEDYGFFELLARTEQAQARGLSFEHFRTMSKVERVAWRWALLNEKTLTDMSGLPNCRMVRYEDLCATPVPVARSLFEFAGLTWSQQTERFIGSSTARNETGYYGVFKDPRQSASKWKTDLSAATIEQILRVVAETRPGALYATEPNLSQAFG